MDAVTNAAWALLALVHASPAAVALAPRLTRRLYGVEPMGELGVLLAHRGVLFLAIVLACVWAIADPPSRRGLSSVVAVSVIGFLALYLRAGAPRGPLRAIALVDAAAFAPLAVVAFSAFGQGVH